MTLVNTMGDNVPAAGSRIFQDGNILVVTLPPIVDLSLYTTLYGNIQKVGDQTLLQILLDCSRVEKLCASGIAAFISLSRLTREKRIGLLILDPPVGVGRQLDPVVPNATWIDSYQEAAVGGG